MSSLQLSWIEGVLAGPRLMRRRPGAMLSWVLVALAGGLVVSAARFWLFRGALRSNFAAAAGWSSLVGTVVNLFLLAVLGAAIIRAEAGERGSGWPRLGGDELRLLALTLPLMLVFVIGFVVISAASGMVFGWFPKGQGPGVAAVITTILLGVSGARLGLAAPMTIAEKRLRLWSALTLTRGYYVPLVLIFLATILASVAIVFGWTYAREALTIAVNATHATGLSEQATSDALRAFILDPRRLALDVLGALAITVALVIHVAPLAYAYRQLRGDPILDRVAVFE